MISLIISVYNKACILLGLFPPRCTYWTSKIRFLSGLDNAGISKGASLKPVVLAEMIILGWNQYFILYVDDKIILLSIHKLWFNKRKGRLV